MKFPSKIGLILGMVIFTGALLRLYNLTAVSLWHDESFSALLLRYPFGEMMTRIGLDVHPPLYYWILRAWDTILGDSLFSLRLFSAVFGILTVCFTYLFIKTAFKSEKLALLSALFIAINPFQIQYATEARMYTLGTFIIILSSWLLIKAIESVPEEINPIPVSTLPPLIPENFQSKITSFLKKYKWWVFYGISAAAAIYTHYYLMFSVAGQAIFILFLLIKNYGKDFSKWLKSGVMRGGILAYLVALISFLPWTGVFLKQLGQVEENYWIPKMDIYSIPNTLWTMIAGSNIYLQRNLLIFVLLIFLAIFVLAAKREKNTYKYLVILSFGIPFLLAIALSFKRSLYLDRYFVFAGVFYLMIFALFINSLEKKIAEKALISVFIITNIAFFARNWQNIAPDGKPGMKAASAYIFKNAKPEEKVFVGSTFIFFTYKYYVYQNLFYDAGYPADFNPSAFKESDNVIEGYRLFPEYATPLLYTPGITRVEQLPHFSGTALLTTDDLLNNFNSGVKPSDGVWVLWTTGFGSSKPEVPKNWRQIDEAGFEDVLGYRGWIVATKYMVE